MVSFFQTSSRFSLVILFVLLLLEPAAMVPVLLGQLPMNGVGA